MVNLLDAAYPTHTAIKLIVDNHSARPGRSDGSDSHFDGLLWWL
jgi:hypothetical protein